MKIHSHQIRSVLTPCFDTATGRAFGLTKYSASAIPKGSPLEAGSIN